MLNKKKLIIVSILLFLILYLVNLNKDIRVSVVNGYSMEPNISSGDTTIYIKNKKLHRFDIISVYPPINNKENPYVKRIIAFENEKLEIVNGLIYINDKLLIQDFEAKQENIVDIGPVKVESGTVFVLGDNRLNSLDSEELGPFYIDDIQGKLVMNFSTNKFNRYLKYDFLKFLSILNKVSFNI